MKGMKGPGIRWLNVFPRWPLVRSIVKLLPDPFGVEADSYAGPARTRSTAFIL